MQPACRTQLGRRLPPCRRGWRGAGIRVWLQSEGFGMGGAKKIHHSSREKRIMLLFLRDGAERTMTAGQHGIARKGQEFLFIVLVLLRVARRAAAHRGGENRVPDNGEWPAQAGDIEARHARRVAGGEQSLD